MRKRKKTLIILVIILFCLILPGFYNALKVVHYEVQAENISQPIRIALVTDLHSCNYGKNQRELVEAIYAEQPDLILLGGDIFDDDLPDENAIIFLQKIGSKYPCYYVTGNHEYWSGSRAFAEKMAALETCGIIRLSGEVTTVEIQGTRLYICGVDDPYAWADSYGFTERTESSFQEQVAHVAALADDKLYSILLTHRPELLNVYSKYDFDLVLAGHAHGGQWRIPGILNGLWAPNQGLFPVYTGGRYEKNGTVMIVSRGLARESTRVPRLYNRPELVMIELH